MEDIKLLIIVQSVILGVFLILGIVGIIFLISVVVKVNKILNKADDIATDIKDATEHINNTASHLEQILNPALLVKFVIQYIRRLVTKKKGHKHE
jgi:septation ring formation regulator EzrA